jgi:hypothetical protein
MTFHSTRGSSANKGNNANFTTVGSNQIKFSSPAIEFTPGTLYNSADIRQKLQTNIAFNTLYINSNNQVISNSASGSYITNSYINGYYNNQIIVNNDINDWNITLPDRPYLQNIGWTNSTTQLNIKKTGSGTLTIQTPSDVLNTITRGINSKNNKSYVLNSSNPQSVILTYVDQKDETGNIDETTEIWYVLKDYISNPVHSNGSILFAGNTSAYLTVANDADLRFGTGDFTIEWWQYETDNSAFPRIFSMGTYPSASIGVSIEGGSFYFWIGGTGNLIAALTNYKNSFNHFAITRSGTTIKVFRNGTQIGSNITSSYNFNDTTNDLRIGNEQTLSSGSSFGGNIKGFHWVKGTALYTTAFTPNYNSITPHANSKLLLNVANSAGLVTDSSSAGKTVTNTGCTFSSITHPFY